jgi:hypothetical protein
MLLTRHFDAMDYLDVTGLIKLQYGLPSGRINDPMPCHRRAMQILPHKQPGILEGLYCEWVNEPNHCN